MKKIIHVTQEDIDKARVVLAQNIAARRRSCPIAQAIMRETGLKVGVGTQRADFDDPFVSPTLPRSARAFIARFDSEKPVKPFNFRLEVPA